MAQSTGDTLIRSNMYWLTNIYLPGTSKWIMLTIRRSLHNAKQIVIHYVAMLCASIHIALMNITG